MITDLETVATFLEQSVRDFTDLAVVGISGGIDSSVVAGVCVNALGKDKVYLVSMPHDEADLASFNARSTELADQLGAHHHIVSIGAATRALEVSMEEVFESESLDILTRANIRPRVRMNVLYSICGELGYVGGERARVMGTGHLSEDLIGYDTKGGDALCDIFILSDLVKSEVYQLAEHYRVPESIMDAVPSAGLYPDQTDEDELGYSYAALERPTLALYRLLKQGIPISAINARHPEFKSIDSDTVKFVVDRYKTHSHKHLAPVTVDVRRCEWFE